jgi:hypothetical protein
MKTFQALLILLFLFSITDAQSSDKSAKDLSRCGKIEKIFDKSKNETNVQLLPYLLEGSIRIDRESGILRKGYNMGDWGFAMSLLYSYTGKDYKAPEKVKLFTLYDGQFFRYETNHKISFDLGTEVIDLGPAIRTTGFPIMTQRVREQLAIFVTTGQLSQIAAAQKVKLKVGLDTFEMTPCHVAGINKFAKTIQ